MLKSVVALLLCASALATPVEQRAPAPTVTIKNGTLVGSNFGFIDSFSGIPYADPPTLTKRLRRPSPITAAWSTKTVTAKPKSCPQFSTTVNTNNLTDDDISKINMLPIFNADSNESEDCLTLNIQRPEGTTASSNLPVVVWIFGGGFSLGGTSGYDASSLIRRSKNLGKSVLYVSVNYRLGGWGFMAGKDLAKEGATNLGLRDQRLALQWVQENIAAFGGDPTKVTIWGESAGAHSVYNHLIINGGDHTYKGKPMFRGAIMNSGSILPASNVTSVKPQNVYNAVVKAAKCDTAANALTCLRNLDYQKFHDAANSVPAITSRQSLDLSYLPRPDAGDDFFPESPEIALKSGKYAKVPVINGNQQDEGTIGALAQRDIWTNDQFVDYFTAIFPENPNARANVVAYTAFYPDDVLGGQPSGSPFGTGGANNLYGQFKRIAAVIGDQFVLLRRVYQNAIYDKVPTWAYQSSYYHNFLPFLGTVHGSDVFYSYAMFGEGEALTRTYQVYWISFINFGHPNGFAAANQNINWPQWDSTARQMLNLISGQSSVLMTDNFRESAYQYQLANVSQFRL